MLLLDTHVVVWLAEQSPRLSRRASAAIRRADSAGGLGIASITIWELAQLISRGRIRSSAPLEVAVSDLVNRAPLQVFEITPRIAALAQQLGSELPADPVDRLIAATARDLGCSVVTADERLRQNPLIQTLW